MVGNWYKSKKSADQIYAHDIQLNKFCDACVAKYKAVYDHIIAADTATRIFSEKRN